MGTGQLNGVLQRLRRSPMSRTSIDVSAAELLAQYLALRAEGAFAALLERYGPMVGSVCRRILGNVHDAEDAFQATFLVLVRKAGSIRPRGMVGNWLYGVAHRTSTTAKLLAHRRAAKEKHMAKPEALAADTCQDLHSLI